MTAAGRALRVRMARDLFGLSEADVRAQVGAQTPTAPRSIVTAMTDSAACATDGTMKLASPCCSVYGFQTQASPAVRAAQTDGSVLLASFLDRLPPPSRPVAPLVTPSGRRGRARGM